MGTENHRTRQDHFNGVDKVLQGKVPPYQWKKQRAKAPLNSTLPDLVLAGPLNV